MKRMAVGVALALLSGCSASSDSKLVTHEVSYTVTVKGPFSSVDIFYTDGDGADLKATLAGFDTTWSKEFTTAKTTTRLVFMAIPRDAASNTALTCVVAVDGVETRRAGVQTCSMTVDLLAA